MITRNVRPSSLLFLAIGAVLWSCESALASPLETQPSPSASPSPSPSLSLGLPLEPMKEPVNDLPDLTLDKEGGIMLTLESSVRMAVQGATAVLKSENETKVMGSTLLQGYGQFLPRVSAQVNYSYQTGNQYLTTTQPTYVNGSSAGAGYSLLADLNLFNGLSDYSGLKAAMLRKDAANLSLHRAKQVVALDIAQGYLQVVLDNQLVKIAQKNLQQSRAREELLREQTRLGARNLSDLFRQQAQTSSDEALLSSSQNKTRSDQIAFLQKLRADVSKNYRFVEPSIPQDGADSAFSDESFLLKTALAQRPDLKASDETADASGWDVKKSWSGYLPKLDLIGGMNSASRYLYSQSVNGQSVVPPTQNNLGYQMGTQMEYTVGIYLNWNLFDRFQTHENVTRARIAANNAEIDAQDFRNRVQGDVRQAFGNYQTSVSQLRSSKKRLDAAQKAYEVIEGRYEVGSASFIDLITAQTTLVQAESARAQVLVDFMLQSKNLTFALGQD